MNKVVLIGRKIKIKTDTRLLDVFHIDLGVLQGSISDRLLFLLAINDLAVSVSAGFLVLFADNASLAISSDTREELLFGVNGVITQVKSFKDRQLFVRLCKL